MSNLRFDPPPPPSRASSNGRRPTPRTAFPRISAFLPLSDGFSLRWDAIVGDETRELGNMTLNGVDDSRACRWMRPRSTTAATRARVEHRRRPTRRRERELAPTDRPARSTSTRPRCGRVALVFVDDASIAGDAARGDQRAGVVPGFRARWRRRRDLLGVLDDDRAPVCRLAYAALARSGPGRGAVVRLPRPRTSRGRSGTRSVATIRSIGASTAREGSSAGHASRAAAETRSAAPPANAKKSSSANASTSVAARGRRSKDQTTRRGRPRVGRDRIGCRRDEGWTESPCRRGATSARRKRAANSC